MKKSYRLFFEFYGSQQKLKMPNCRKICISFGICSFRIPKNFCISRFSTGLGPDWDLTGLGPDRTRGQPTEYGLFNITNSLFRLEIFIFDRMLTFGILTGFLEIRKCRSNYFPTTRLTTKYHG